MSTSESPAPALLTFDAIIAAEEAAQDEVVRLPAWGGSVKIRALKTRELDEIDKLATRDGKVDDDRKRALLLCESLVEPKLEFSQAVKLLQDGRAGALATLWAAINRVNGLGAEAVDEADKSV